NDALRHGVEVKPIDVAASCWQCTLEAPSTATTGSSAQGTAHASGAAVFGGGARSEPKASEAHKDAPEAWQVHRNDGLEGHRSDPPANYKPSSSAHYKHSPPGPSVRLPL